MFHPQILFARMPPLKNHPTFFWAILCALQYWPMQYTHKKERKKENKENNTQSMFSFFG